MTHLPVSRSAARAASRWLACACFFTAACLIGLAQQPRTVADSIYTDAQATRGALSYEAACSSCHRADLGGGTGPALKEDRFARDYAGKPLKVLFTKISTTMPRNAGGSLGENVYLDIVAHLLKENGFPPGQNELSAADLDGIQVVPGRPKPPPPLGDFSYVDVVGCLTPGPENTWLLTRGSDPVATLPGASASPEARQSKPLGSQTYRLLDALAYSPDARKGQKISVRGLLIKLPDEQRLTISSLEVASPTCSQ